MVASPPENEHRARQEARWGPRNTAGVTIASSLAFEDIGHHYGGQPVLENVSIHARAGEVLCLLGPSGSGKTTLLRIAAGIEKPASGRVLIDGRPVVGEGVDLPPERRGVGLVFQDYALFPHLTIVENVRFGLTGVDRRQAIEEANRLLARVGLEQYGAMYPHQLSGGEQQRVALARALAPRPGILLMDEPFSGLDARLRDIVREETIGLLRDTRSTAIIVTHDPEEALRVADQIALMREGRLVQAGTGEDLYYRPANLFAAGFFSELNLFSCRARGGVAVTPLGDAPAAGLAEGAAVTVGLRLADVLVEPMAVGGARGVAGRIERRRFVGVAELLDLRIAQLDEPVRARIRAGQLPLGLDEVTVRMGEGAAMVFTDG